MYAGISRESRGEGLEDVLKFGIFVIFSLNTGQDTRVLLVVL